ncbi:unnamed protein product [Paramecium sonneborni]|uniref:Uncharacterized protein n=1 Tax=Paramecium sonneborni TaxID=65129 RepID=A0A8S1RWH7_9CILI|nr:unnamed protein product [Paramecium sonneborni]
MLQQQTKINHQLLLDVCPKFRYINYRIISITQEISSHTDNVNFFKIQTNIFISGSDDNNKNFGNEGKQLIMICKQQLDGHTDSIVCLICNKTEDLIISGGEKNCLSLKMNGYFLKKLQLNKVMYLVYLQIFHIQFNQLISCGIKKMRIRMFIKIISVEQYELRVCLIDDDAFTFQSRNHNRMHIYQMKDKNYFQTKQINIYNGNNLCFFFQQFIKQKQILVIRSTLYIKVNPNSEFVLKYSIEFNPHFIYETLSEDGKYLLSWSHQTKEISIRMQERISQYFILSLYFLSRQVTYVYVEIVCYVMKGIKYITEHLSNLSKKNSLQNYFLQELIFVYKRYLMDYIKAKVIYILYLKRIKFQLS